MKNHELLDMIGEVNEDFVLKADSKVVRPRFRWKALAACAACGLLVLAAYPMAAGRGQSKAADSAPEEAPALHAYTVVEGGGAVTENGALKKAPEGEAVSDGVMTDQAPPVPEPAQPFRGEGPGAVSGGAAGADDQGQTAIAGSGMDGDSYWTGDIPVDEGAAKQYDLLLRGMGMDGENGADRYPDWFAGAWIDHGGGADDPAWLTVAIVDGFRTPQREAEITGWCGEGVVFRDANYSHSFLDGLMEPVCKALEGTGLSCGIGVDVIANCLGVDIYSGGAVIPDSVLAELARLDPAGDAIRVRLFTGKLDALTDEAVKGSAPDVPLATPALTKDDAPHPTPVDGDKVYHGENIPADAVPGGAYAGELPEGKEEGKAARYDLLPLEG